MVILAEPTGHLNFTVIPGERYIARASPDSHVIREPFSHDLEILHFVRSRHFSRLPDLKIHRPGPDGSALPPEMRPSETNKSLS